MNEPLYFLGCNFPEKIASLDCPVMLSINGFFKKRGNKYTCRKQPFNGGNHPMIFDSGAFSRISRLYGYKNHLPTRTYAQVIWRFKNCCNLVAVVVQDYMCEEYILSITGLDILTHQRLTLHRRDRLVEELDRLAQDTGEAPPYIMPVLQGYEPDDYLRHFDNYGSRLLPGDWIGIGSVCKRNANPGSIWAILNQLPTGFRWHGFGVKRTALQDGAIRGCFYSVDSQAGSLGSYGKPRKQTKYQYANDWNHALNYRASVINSPVQLSLLPQLYHN
ncbi:hypothetical protein [Nostoc sp. MS1]|uniref:deazapurine DNA modification protein DpdA family protein n=1 Tax=Nostoc sp. MS1 TaxID=2764711 RepID=UPI001CC7229B|nr:hypothetical protein [Nostoc sp. MS1]